MRLSRAGDGAAAAALLQHANEIGITTFHCSSEYETFPLFRQAWRQAEVRGAKMIAKVAVPHFGEDRFSVAAFRDKIDFYLDALALERLDVVQWLLRYDLKQEEARLRILNEAAAEIAGVVEDLKHEGKIGSCVGFPYTPQVADALLEADYCDGLAVYVNPLEREMDQYVEAAAERHKVVIAIRPFAAGRLFAETRLTAQDALEHVFRFPAVATAVVSASSKEHLDALRPHLTLA
jgi:aryl-alcohol dehydrogenase-like predicted oxidoreductase